MDIQTALLTAAPYLVPFLVALAVGLGKSLLQNLPTNQREEAARLAQVAVQAAEQSMPGATGPDKKAAVEADLQAVFSHAHLNLPPALVNMFIEAAVSAMNADRPQPTMASTSSVGFVPPSDAVTGPTLRHS